MIDLNHCYLTGTIGEDFRYKHSQDGKEFATFTLLVNSYDKEMHDGTEQRQITFLRIMVFDRHCVEYLHNVNARHGHHVHIIARINSHRVEYKGHTYIQNDVVARRIFLLATQSMARAMNDKQEQEQ